MKLLTHSLFLVGLILTSCNDPGVEPTETVYYWAGGKRILLDLNRKTVIGIYKPDLAHPYLRPEIM